MHAFDEAWASIAPTIDPASAKNARQSLADAIMAHASTLGTDDFAALKAAAFLMNPAQLTSCSWITATEHSPIPTLRCSSWKRWAV
jgi:hypothetical protein